MEIEPEEELIEDLQVNEVVVEIPQPKGTSFAAFVLSDHFSDPRQKDSSSESHSSETSED